MLEDASPSTVGVSTSGRWSRDYLDRLSLPVILLPIVLLALAPRLWLAWASIERLVLFVPDDSFYYFTIARNVANGFGSTFDGVGPTNGYHPLWLVLLCPIWWIADAGDAPVHLALSLGALLGAGSAILVFFTGVHLHSRLVGVIAAALFSLAPRSVLLSIDGLETSLALFLSLACLLLTYRYFQSPGTRAVAALAACCGFLLLARTDAVFLVFLIGLVVLCVGIQRHRLDHPVRFAGLAFTILMPWLLWNLITFGTILQVSGNATPWMLHETGQVRRGVALLIPYSQIFFKDYGVAYSYASFQVIAVLLALFALSMARAKERRRPALIFLLLPMLHLAFLLAVHGGYRMFPRVWYFALLAPVLVFSLTIAVVRAPRTGVWYRLALLSALVIVVLSQRSAIERLRGGDYPWQGRFLEGVQRVDALPAGSTVAAFNSGILGYYSSRRIINLDGVVSNAAFRALQSYTLDRYLRRQDVAYLVDWHLYTHDQYAPFLRGVPLDEVERFRPADGVLGAYSLYALRSSSSASRLPPGGAASHR